MVNISKFLANHFVILAVLLTTVLPVTADASVLSWLFGSADAETTTSISAPNSQNMALLVAPISPGQATSTSEVAIVGGTSLLPETPLASDANNATNDQISLYVVHAGDTLPAIAKMFGVSVNTIRWANNLNGSLIKTGQTLVILPISGVQYVVKKGDTVQSIAKALKGDVTDIMQYNNLTADAKLAVGDIVVVPDGELGGSSSSSSGGSSGGSGNSGGSGSTPVGGYCQNYPSIIGYYMRPVVNCIKTQGIHGHNGVDLASSYGSNILAAADGQVIISRDSGWNGGYGSYIVLKHGNGTETLYAHLSATLVNVGDNVSQGDVIGKMGHSGDVNGPTGTHLHFEIRGARNPF